MTRDHEEDCLRESGLPSRALVEDNIQFRLWLMDTLMQIRSNHARCRQELRDDLDAHQVRLVELETRLSAYDTYLKRAVLIGVSLVASGAAGSEFLKRLLEML